MGQSSTITASRECTGLKINAGSQLVEMMLLGSLLSPTAIYPQRRTGQGRVGWWVEAREAVVELCWESK